MPPTNEEALFALAVVKPATERAAWLDRECSGDKILRTRLEALLAALEQPDTLLATQAGAGLRRAEFHESPRNDHGLAELAPPRDEADEVERFGIREDNSRGSLAYTCADGLTLRPAGY